jgi:hypothetical protein
MENVELDETLFDQIEEGDTIFCDFDSSDIWLNLNININTNVSKVCA